MSEDINPPVGDATYQQLRRIAAGCFRGSNQPTLQPTALVHEAWMKLARNSPGEHADRNHFRSLVARVMRQILVDHARARNAKKRGAAPPS